MYEGIDYTGNGTCRRHVWERKGKKNVIGRLRWGRGRNVLLLDLWTAWRAAWEMCLWDGYSGSWVSVTQQMRLKTRE